MWDHLRIFPASTGFLTPKIFMQQSQIISTKNRPSAQIFENTIPRWDEAIPVGNGLIGALFWGGPREWRVSLDRSDLWDLRTPAAVRSPLFSLQELQRLVKDGDLRTIRERFTNVFDEAYPTRIPPARLKLDLPRSVLSAELDRATGTARLTTEDGNIEAFVAARRQLLVIRTTGTACDIQLIPRTFAGEVGDIVRFGGTNGPLTRLGYPAAKIGGDQSTQWFEQETADDHFYAVCMRTQRQGHEQLVLTSIEFLPGRGNALKKAKEEIALALENGYDAIRDQHEREWSTFWNRSTVDVPEAAIADHYTQVNYFLASSTRDDTPPMALQGVWTADEDQLPPWKGDYHNDLNTQLCYWSYLNSGHFERGRAFMEHYWRIMPVHRRFARHFFGTEGIAVPGAMALDGEPISGWPQYCLAPTNGAWVAHMFYMHWRYTADVEFLKTRALPYCREIGTCIGALLKRHDDGCLYLPLSSSPEVHDDSLEAYVTPNSNFDLSLCIALFSALIEMERAVGKNHRAAEWARLMEGLPSLAIGAVDSPDQQIRAGVLLVAPGEPLMRSHRHFSNMMPVYPLGMLTPESGDADREVALASIQQMEMLGTGEWCGYSYTWMACMLARFGQGTKALRFLRRYLDAFVSPNGFHLNGDYKDLGECIWKYRPFTLEASFPFAQAVHEMLLQSWGGVIRLFPAVPVEWKTTSFDRLRAEGGFVVSAAYESGRVTSLKLSAAVEQQLCLRMSEEAAAKLNWWGTALTRDGQNLVGTLMAGEFVEAIEL